MSTVPQAIIEEVKEVQEIATSTIELIGKLKSKTQELSDRLQSGKEHFYMRTGRYPTENDDLPQDIQSELELLMTEVHQLDLAVQQKQAQNGSRFGQLEARRSQRIAQKSTQIKR